MKIDNDCKERLRVFFAFGLEVYKIAMGTFLSLFVPKACEDDCPTSTTPTLLGAASFWTNAATFFSIIVLYTVELRRENWMIRHLDVDSDKPDSYLALVAPDDVKSSLHAWNGWYWKWPCWAWCCRLPTWHCRPFTSPLPTKIPARFRRSCRFRCSSL